MTISAAMRSTTTRARDAPAAGIASRRPPPSSAAQAFTCATASPDMMDRPVPNHSTPTKSE
jgi:hypothetical protein